MPKPTADPTHSSAQAPPKPRRVTPATPPKRQSTAVPSLANDRADTAATPGRHLTDQQRIDEAFALRKKGWSHKRIAAHLDCGQKTIQGILKGVQPELH